MFKCTSFCNVFYMSILRGFLLKLRVLQFFLYLLVTLGTSEFAMSSSRKESDVCREAVTNQNRNQSAHFFQQTNKNPSSAGIKEPHYITMFSIEDLGIGSEFLEQARKVFAGPNALEWDFYLQRQNQIEYLKSHLPDNILSRITNTIWSDFYYGRNTKSMEDEFLQHLNRISLMEYQLIRPIRLRAISRFNLDFEERRWEVQQLKTNSFRQSDALLTGDQQDFRMEGERQFRELHLEDLQETLIKILQGLASLIHTYNPEVSHLEASVHFMKIIKRPWSFQVVTNSPEGVHQDGMDFVVSGLVIERENIQGGQSLIYDARRAPVMKNGNPDFKEHAPDKKVILLPGYGLLHRDQDSPFWHETTPIELQDPLKEGYRSIIGIDFQVR